MRVSAGENQSHINTGYLSSSSIDATEDCTKKRIRLGNDNYVISIEPFKENRNKSINELNDLNESETDPPPVVITQPNNNNHPAYNRVHKTIIKKTTNNSSSFCSCCRFFIDLFSLFIQCIRCFASCFCSPCCFATALFGGIAAVFGVAALGFIGIIPIPVNWANSICNATESYRNVFVTYENVTLLDRSLFSTFQTTTQISGNNYFVFYL